MGLRIEEIAQDVILKDEERMRKSKTAHARNLFWKIWKSRKLHDIFSEESSRIMHVLGNIELYELGQMSSTVQCYSCFKHMPEGLAFCSCGMCFRPDEATITRIKGRFQTLIVPCYFARINRSRGKKRGETLWQHDHWQAVDAKRERSQETWQGHYHNQMATG